MDEIIKLLSFLNQNPRKLHKVDVFLYELSYKEYHEKSEFLKQLESEDYLEWYVTGLNPNGVIYNSGIDGELIKHEYNTGGNPIFTAKIKFRGIEFLDTHKQSKSNRLAAWWAAYGQWVSGIGTIIAILVTIILWYCSQKND
jgi:hypothetical protein